MFEFHERRRWRRVVYSRPVLIVMIVFLIFLVRGTWNIWEKERQSRAARLQSGQELGATQKRYDALVVKVDKLQTKDGIEEELRSKFGVAKPGEKVVVIVDNRASTETATSTDEGFWQHIKDWFSW